MIAGRPAADSDRLLKPGYRWRLLLILLLVCTLNFADRAVLSAVIEPIKTELRLTDAHLGLLQGLSFALLYTLIGLPIGRLAERRNRLVILAACTTVFSLATFLCGLATGFLQLFLLRMMVGIGEGGFMAPTSSLVSDHYPRSRRASALAVIMLGSPLGYLIGAAAGGWIAQEYGWRTAFFAMGVPGLLVAGLLLLVLIEPARGLADGMKPSREAPPGFLATLRHVFGKPTYRQVVTAGVVTTFGMIAIGQFQFPFFMRVHDLSLAETGIVSGLTTSISLALGTLIGGYGADFADRFDRRWNVWLPAVGVMLAAIAYLAGFLATTLPGAIAGIFAGNVLVFFYYTPTYAMAQNLVGPRMRATSVALLGMFVGLIGAGLGPTYLGLASDLFAGFAFGGDFSAACPGGRPAAGASPGLAAACSEAAASGIRYALASVCLAFIWGGIHFLLAARTLAADLFVAPPTATPETETGPLKVRRRPRPLHRP